MEKSGEAGCLETIAGFESPMFAGENQIYGKKIIKIRAATPDAYFVRGSLPPNPALDISL